MDAETAYLFRHALLRDAVYQLMLPGVRAELHARVVEAAEQGPGLRLGAREIAGHARAAQEDAEPQTARRMRERERHWLRIASEKARARSDLAASQLMLERLLELERGTPDEFETRVALAEMLRETGQLARAEAMLEQARAVAGDDAARLPRVQGALASVYIRTGRLREAADLEQEVLRAHREAGNESAVSEALGTLGVVQYHLGDFARAEDCYRQACEAAAGQGDGSRLARFTANLALLLADAGRYDEAEQAQREAMRLAEQAGDRLALGNSVGNYALLLTNLERFDEAEDMYRRALQLEREVGHLPGYAVALANYGRLMRMMRRLDEAERLLQVAAGLHREVASARNEGSALGQLADLFAAQGRFDDALAYFNRGIERLAQAQDRMYEGVLRTGRGRLRLLLTDLAGAREDLARAQELLDEPTPESYRLLCLYPLQAYVAAASLEEGKPLQRVTAEVAQAAARYEAHPGFADERDVNALLQELRRAESEGGEARLHFGRLLSQIPIGAIDALLERLADRHPALARKLRRLMEAAE